jgi:hypothetical protein
MGTRVSEPPRRHNAGIQPRLLPSYVLSPYHPGRSARTPRSNIDQSLHWGTEYIAKDALGPRCRDGEDMLGVYIEMYTSIAYKKHIKGRCGVIEMYISVVILEQMNRRAHGFRGNSNDY